ncbi:ATP phosphoribosyltransferase regulatory subunit [methane-oxidizing endosymbiont of Gigantopelta aegis]|uniref:ATP phosphoribosyltransferase regulatory subunit n=1 Tax=methane-oxidizing endosymbiont of Gigantopelta aegis TaxID=2794938 RepID=UPI0018DD226C|nr:ATP phosphoribosyltransferase regulatory subunit [methane-oxidizing endosymbiont of Gigantopelta aegis]
MQTQDSWLLPEGIEEVLPGDAAQLEQLRRNLLDVFSAWGYQLVFPPLMDFLDSLLIGTGHDLDLNTFKLTDQVSGRTLGIRADMTPQVARIAGHHMSHSVPTRLCYVGTVLHTLGDELDKDRSPVQIGAELYGYDGLEGDFEIIQLMLEMLAMSGIEQIHLDLGHVGIYRALARQAGVTERQEAELFDVLQRKAIPEMDDLLNAFSLHEKDKQTFKALATLHGGLEVFERAETVLKGYDDSVQQALADLKAIAEKLSKIYPALPINFDLAELRGYYYHTGIVFAALVPGLGKEIARGGRYDNIGEAFATARSATGFSADLKRLARQSVNSRDMSDTIVFAPYCDDEALRIKIRGLRAEGVTVIQQLPGQKGDAKSMGCTALLAQENQNWIVKALD